MRYARAGGARRFGIFRGGSLDICCPLVASLPCQKLSCQNFLLFYSDWCQPLLWALLSMVEFFAIPQLPDCTPQSAKYSSFCQYYTVDLEDKQLYFPVYIINFSEYYYIHILLFWYVHSVCSRFEFQVGHKVIYNIKLYIKRNFGLFPKQIVLKS